MQFASIAWNVKSCFLGNEKKNKKKDNEFNLSSAELAQRDAFPPMLGLYNASLFYSFNKLFANCMAVYSVCV